MRNFFCRAVAVTAAFVIISTIWAGAAVATVGTPAVPAAYAQDAPPPGPGGPGGSSRRSRMAKILADLGLSDQQKAQIRSIMRNARNQNQNVTDPQQRRSNMENAFAQVRNVLTPDQRSRFDAKMREMRAQYQNGQGAHGT